MSAVEFALLLPLMLAMIVGMTELSHAVNLWRKVTVLARTVSDLTSQGDTDTTKPIRAETMADILVASKLVMQPFDSSTVKIVVSALGVDLNKPSLRPQVCSSIATPNTTPRPVETASDLTAPPGFQLPGSRYILTEVSVSYTPLFGSSLLPLFQKSNNQITLTASFPWPTRGGQPFGLNTNSEVILPSGSRCPTLL